jgi:hypothetical protein
MQSLEIDRVSLQGLGGDGVHVPLAVGCHDPSLFTHRFKFEIFEWVVFPALQFLELVPMTLVQSAPISFSSCCPCMAQVKGQPKHHGFMGNSDEGLVGFGEFQGFDDFVCHELGKVRRDFEGVVNLRPSMTHKHWHHTVDVNVVLKILEIEATAVNVVDDCLAIQVLRRVVEPFDFGPRGGKISISKIDVDVRKSEKEWWITPPCHQGSRV